ncbi:MAG: mannitol dehydrogenase family protein [Eubacteriales bacterium]|nr:mannitol dehydrogenase family protein [Eubacteriales bacterium]
MKLTINGIKDTAKWQAAGVELPSYDVEKVAAATKESPVWVHFGAGNIFRIFIGGLADRLISQGEMEKGITCVETFDFDVVDKIYKPYDNLVLAVTLKADGSTEKQVIGSLTEAIKAQSADEVQWNRLKTIFENPGLQMISFTITEKGYALKNADGGFFPFIQADIDNGPEKPGSAMAVVCALLFERYKNGGAPLAVVSMDNCSHNGEKLQASILTMAKEWQKKGFVDEGFVAYLEDEKKIAFPWSMIDKITPRPAESVCDELKKLGVEDMDPVITGKRTYIAPFVNAEGPQYLVVEDKFPNGRPALEKAGVYMTDRDTVNKVERMKVTTCLNPLHTALAVYGCVLGYTLIADEMKDTELNRLVHEIGPVEGMPVVTDPGILSPKDFVDEVINVRIPNPFMPDTPQRIATDTSQKVGIRYGETIKSYVAKYGDAKKLKAIPLAIAGWCRYLLAVDDNGEAFELSADPMVEELTARLKGIELGKPETYTGQLKEILSNVHIFGIDLYEAGIGEMIEELFKEEIAGPGAVRATLKKYLSE